MKYLFIRIILLALSFTSCTSSKEVEIRLIHTTDVHGNILTYDYINQTPSTGGMARLSTMMQEMRKDNEHVLLLDGGDFLQGDPITYYSNYVDTGRMNAVAVAMNALKYDATVIGNHDIEPGKPIYDRFVKEASFPVLGANVVDKQSGKPYFEPYRIFERGGVKLLVLGLTTPAIPHWLPEFLWAGLRFDDIVESAKRWVPELIKKEQPHIFIALIHSGLTNDNEDYLEQAGERLASEVPGIDIILMGHDHRQTNKWIKRSGGADSVLLINPANHLDWVSDITIRVKMGSGKVHKEIIPKLTSVNDYAPDKKYVEHLLPYEEGVKKFLDKRVGMLSEPVVASDALVGSSRYLNVLHQMQLFTVQADLSFAAPLSIRAELSSGDIFVRDLFKWCPFSNYLYVMALSGEEIKGYLEHSYAGWANEMKVPEDRLIAMRPGAKASDRYKTLIPTYNFSSAYGIDYTVDVTKPKGNRVQITQLSNGQPFIYTHRYRVAINSYRAGGAGGMLTSGAGIPKTELQARILDTSRQDQFMSLMKYFETKGIVIPSQTSNWSFVPKAWVEPAGKGDVAFILSKE